MKTGYFETQDKEGNVNKSSSRLNSTIIIIFALLLAEQVVVFGWLDGSLITGAASAGTLFLTIAGSAMYFMFNQKKQEIEKLKN